MNKGFLGRKGFTLTEMLVIIAIIGLISAIVTASTSAARQKARDEARLGDLRTIQLGLALYNDVNRGYPAGNDISALNVLVTQKYLPAIPTDPFGAQYEYMLSGSRYCLGATVERTPPEGSAVCTSAPSGSTANYKVQR